MTAKFAAALALAAALAWSGSSTAAGSVEAGQAKSGMCMGCHGMDGNSVNPEWPNLASQHASYILRQLKGFKANERTNPLMTPMAVMLQEQDIEDLAAYFSSQKLNLTGETDPAKLKLGERIYRGGSVANGVPPCAGCHGPDGRGNPGAAYPNLRGQHSVYVGYQLRNYKAGTRMTDPNQMMRTIATKLSEAEIDAVASYVQGLR